VRKAGLRRIVLGLAILPLAAWGGLRYGALPYAVGRLAAAVQQAGYADITPVITGGLTLQARLQQGEQTILALQFSPVQLIGQYLGGHALALGQVTVTCPQAAQVAPAPLDGSARAAWLGQPLALPALPDLKIDELRLTCGDVEVGAELRLAGQQLHAQGQIRTPQGVFDVSALDWQLATDQLTASGSLKTAAMQADVTLSRQFKEGQPVLQAKLDSRDLKFQNQPIGLVVTVNQAQAAGLILPVSAELHSQERVLTLAGPLDLANAAATLNLSGGFKTDTLQLAGVRGTVLLNWQKDVQASSNNLAVQLLQPGGLPFTDVRAALKYAGHQLQVGQLQAKLFGGAVQVKPLRFEVPVQQVSADVAFDGLELEQLIKLGAVDGLDGQGQLSGQVPVQYAQGKLTLGAATLTAQQAGTIHYQPVVLPSFMAPGGQGALIGEIFKDFRYDGLELTLGGTLGDNLTLGVRLAGSNPSFYNGHAVVFNLNLSGALESLLTKGLQSFQFTPQALGELVREGERK